ncbi:MULTISPECIES: hypothetical protein [Bacillaceae]|uniref:hypothetical protein n=1 Tax=Bacillaceae TaxID=186817 RepID=UPI000BFE412E|nr:hypothetical protein [Metabacillus litoralis]MCM3164345.1 hypothetical protein [Metabacillus litoralis]PGT85081.1 hypothetical protein COD11_09565 [Bacillus sp. AFS040349]
MVFLYKYTIKEKGWLKGINNPYYKQKVFINRNLYYPFTKEEVENLHVKIKLIEPRKEWKTPEQVPRIVSKLSVLFKDELLFEVPIYYDNG